MNEIVLPDPNTMMARLTEVDGNPHMVEHFYPRLTQFGGQMRVPVGLVMMLQLAAADYMEGLPVFVVAPLRRSLHRFVPALVEDETMQAEVLDLFAAVGLPTA